jgi:hypothetical protein
MTGTIVQKGYSDRIEFALGDGRHVMVEYNPPNRTPYLVCQAYVDGIPFEQEESLLFGCGWNEGIIEKHFRRKIQL